MAPLNIPSFPVIPPEERPQTTWGRTGGDSSVVRAVDSSHVLSERLAMGWDLGPGGEGLRAERWALCRPPGKCDRFTLHGQPYDLDVGGPVDEALGVLHVAEE
jgi:hypothetical protein